MTHQLNTIAAAVLREAASQQFNLLNWDEEVYPTPLKDLEENIRTYVASRLGWPLWHVSIVGTVLTIEGKAHDTEDRYGHVEQILVYDFATRREIAGRVTRLAHLDLMQMEQIRKVVMRNL